VLLITIGVLFALDHLGDLDFSRTWPILIIVIGLMKLFERSTAAVPPPGPFGPVNYAPPSYAAPSYTPPSYSAPNYPPPANPGASYTKPAYTPPAPAPAPPQAPNPPEGEIR
jgi:hypothetical protein